MAAMTKTARKIKSIMVKRGTWQPDFQQAVEKLADMEDMYGILYEQFKAGGCTISTTDEHGKEHKTLLFSKLETMPRDMLPYYTALGLVPSGLKKLDAKMSEGGTSPLAAALRKFDAG